MIARLRWFAVVLVMCGCGSIAPAPASTPTSAADSAGSCNYYDYRFELDAALRTLTATVCFDGPPPKALVCGPQADPENAPNAERISAELVTPLSTRGCRIELDGFLPGDCVRYSVDLRALPTPQMLAARRDTDQMVTAQTGEFLYRPEARGPHIHGHATFVLPDGMRASLPWERDADGYLLDASAFELVGYAAFGVLDTESIQAAGATIDVALLAPVATETRAAIVPWITRVASIASRLGGAFPADRAQVLLQPLPGAGGVRFGMIGRGGGPSIVFLFGRDSTEAELIQSWEPAHEITHLRTPYLMRADRWLTEGIATYFQEVLRARDEVVTPEQAWQRLAIGFARGQQDRTGRTLRAEAADMYTSGAFQSVYWFGAALALLADVELRTTTNNRVSLDTAVLQLQACCAREARTWTADQMIARLDSFAGQPVMRTLTDRYLDGTAFPDVATALSQLGVTISGNDITLDASAPHAATRDAIMAPQAPPPPSLTAPQ